MASSQRKNWPLAADMEAGEPRPIIEKMLRNSKIVKGLANWLLGGISTRLEFGEQDLEKVQQDTHQLKRNQRKLAKTFVEAQNLQLNHNVQQMIALRRMHSQLQGRLGQAFPGKHCAVCGGGLIFERESSENAYSLRCPNRCGKKLILPESNLLESMRKAAVK
jgi:DNA repair exonuclease SbcCD ATPase subunit